MILLKPALLLNFNLENLNLTFLFDYLVGKAPNCGTAPMAVVCEQLAQSCSNSGMVGSQTPHLAIIVSNMLTIGLSSHNMYCNYSTQSAKYKVKKLR